MCCSTEARCQFILPKFCYLGVPPNNKPALQLLLSFDLRGLFGGRTRARTWDPLIKSQWN